MRRRRLRWPLVIGQTQLPLPSRKAAAPRKFPNLYVPVGKLQPSKVRVTLNFLFRKNTLLPFLVEQGVEFSKINNGSTQLLRLQEQTQESSKQVHSTVSFSMLHCFAWSGHQLNFMLLFWAIVFFPVQICVHERTRSKKGK
jgi:hypothetical protein